MLTILTGNQNKLKDLQTALSPIETKHINMELEEIQELDARRVIEHKLNEAHKKHPNSEFLIDDRSLVIEGLNGLPGTFVKWFLETVGAEGIYNFAKTSNSMKAFAIAWVGFKDSEGNSHFFLGEVPGTIVPARGSLDYGWGPIFQPDGSQKTFGEMTIEEKSQISHYGVAIKKFKEFYLTR